MCRSAPGGTFAIFTTNGGNTMRINLVWRPTRLALALGALVVTTLGAPATVHAAEGGDLESGITCQDMPLVTVQTLVADSAAGAPDVVPARVTGHRYLFDAGGYVVPQVTAPEGWSPLLATDEELATFGVEPRPTDPDALAAWNEAYSHWTGSVTPGMCQVLVSNPLRSSNWSGLLNSSSSATAFTRSGGSFVQPTFEAACPHASAHSVWAGLGGNGVQRLLQSGTAASQSSLNGIEAWWEAISPNLDTYQQNFTGLAISPGQTVRPATTYVPATSTRAGYAVMSVYNATTGKSATTGAISSINNVPISQFYNGGTSEFVDERPSAAGLKYPVDGQYFYFRKTHNSWTNWAQALTNGVGFRTYPYSTLDMIRPNGNLLADAYVPSSGSRFEGYWDACA